MISSVSRPERDRNPEKTLPPGPSDNASSDSRSRLARESRRDFSLWLKTADRQRHPHSDKQREKERPAPPPLADPLPLALPLPRSTTPSSATSQNLLLGVTSDNSDFQNSFRTHAARHGIRTRCYSQSRNRLQKAIPGLGTRCVAVGIRQILDPFGLIGLLTGSGGLRPPRICCPRLRYSGRPHTPFEQ